MRKLRLINLNKESWARGTIQSSKSGKSLTFTLIITWRKENLVMRNWRKILIWNWKSSNNSLKVNARYGKLHELKRHLSWFKIVRKAFNWKTLAILILSKS